MVAFPSNIRHSEISVARILAYCMIDYCGVSICSLGWLPKHPSWCERVWIGTNIIADDLILPHTQDSTILPDLENLHTPYQVIGGPDYIQEVVRERQE